MKQLNETPISANVQRCPFVGLHDDPGTCLAYPSFWNYCYRARPPASVMVSHQVTACLSQNHIHCPVFLTAQRTPLPASVRGVAPLRKHGSATRVSLPLLLALFFLLGIAVVLLNQYSGLKKIGEMLFSNGPVSTPLVLTGDVNRTDLPPVSETVQVATKTIFAPSESPIATPTRSGLTPSSLSNARTATMTPAPSYTPSRTPTFTLTATRAATKMPTLTLTPTPLPTKTITLTSPSVGVCGHALDSPFGGEIQFVVHRVRSGENLNMYADSFHTTIEAIVAVNYHLPVPVWENWIIVIPVETATVSAIPPFETYQALGTTLSMEDLAKELDTDAQSLQKYNAFETSCKSFSGWILVPRQADPDQ